MAEDLNNRLYGFHLKSSYQGHHVGGSDRLGSYDEIKDIAREMIDKLALGGRNVADEPLLQDSTSVSSPKRSLGHVRDYA